ncbi:MAG: MmcQ/YjbR family DNA-binding protein [Kofleriaceae bacterium]
MTKRRQPGNNHLDLASLTTYCEELPGSTGSRPFGPDVLVFKVAKKVFALLGDRGISMKCDPDRSLILRTSYPAITPGWHLNKTHWNTIALDGSVPNALVLELVDHAHDLVKHSAKARKPRRAIKRKSVRSRE